MQFQLGTKVFDGLFAPSALSFSGNEANIAEYPLINQKPRVQHTGNMLELMSFRMKLRIEFCNPDQEIKDLRNWKENGEVLPLLIGDGQYKGDFLIRSVPYEVVQTFPDGTIIEANVSIELVEHIPFSREEQQAQQHRKDAIAINTTPSQNPRRTKKTPESEAHSQLMKAQLEAWNATNEAEKALETGDPETFADDLSKSVTSAQEAMSNARQQVMEVQETVNSATGIINSTLQAMEKLEELQAILEPPITLTDLADAITNSKTALRLVESSSKVFTNDVILRRI